MALVVLSGVDLASLASELGVYRPDVTVLTTAPSYLSWSRAPPELRVPMQTARVLRPYTERLFIVGPHASTRPAPCSPRLGCCYRRSSTSKLLRAVKLGQIAVERAERQVPRPAGYFEDQAIRKA
jgi:hypothetical protein